MWWAVFGGDANHCSREVRKKMRFMISVDFATATESKTCRGHAEREKIVRFHMDFVGHKGMCVCGTNSQVHRLPSLQTNNDSFPVLCMSRGKQSKYNTGTTILHWWIEKQQQAWDACTYRSTVSLTKDLFYYPEESLIWQVSFLSELARREKKIKGKETAPFKSTSRQFPNNHTQAEKIGGKERQKLKVEGKDVLLL